MKMKACTVLLATVVVFTVEVFGESREGSTDCGDQQPPCEVLESPPKSVFKIGECQVSTLPTKRVKCLLKREKIRNESVIDISVILKKLKINQDVLLIVQLLCSTPLHLFFKNSQNTTKKYPMLYLKFQGHCNVSAGNISRWRSATDFRGLHMLENSTWLEDIDNVLCTCENTECKEIYTLPDEEFSKGVKSNGFKIRIRVVHLEDRTFKIIASVLGGFLFLTLVTLVVFRYRDAIKVFVFTRFNWYPFDRRDDSDPSKIYDAFVSYSGSDYKWVMDTLQVRLENHDPPFKLCIDQRDFEIGAPILENILNGINQSKRMIVVLSRNFIKSKLCLLEFRAAHQKVLEDGMNYLIIILFDDVDMAEVHDEIKLYMRTNTYLSVSNRWFWEKLVYTLPQNRERIPDHQSDCTNSGLEHTTEMVLKNEAFEATGTTGEPLSL